MKRISQEDLLYILQHTDGIWHSFNNKSIFITGATGFFGKWLLESFLYINKKLLLNASVCALSRDPEAFLGEHPYFRNEPSITFIKGDIRDFVFPSGIFQFVIHAATDADAKLNNENPLLMLDTIIEGTKRVLEFAMTQPVESFLLTSSGAIYGQQPSHVTHVKETENFTVNINDPAAAYAEGKRIAELYSAIYYRQFNLPVKIARCFAFVGPHLPLDKHFAIGNFILNGLNNEDIIIKGDGTPYRSYLYAADLAVWLWTILVKGEDNTPYNVGSDDGISIRETAQIVAEALSNTIEVQILTQTSGFPSLRYVPDISKAAQLNLNVKTDLKKAVSKTLDFYSGIKN